MLWVRSSLLEPNSKMLQGHAHWFCIRVLLFFIVLHEWSEAMGLSLWHFSDADLIVFM
jgi:hypothetical protein